MDGEEERNKKAGSRSYVTDFGPRPVKKNGSTPRMWNSRPGWLEDDSEPMKTMKAGEHIQKKTGDVVRGMDDEGDTASVPSVAGPKSETMWASAEIPKRISISLSLSLSLCPCVSLSALLCFALLCVAFHCFAVIAYVNCFALLRFVLLSVVVPCCALLCIDLVCNVSLCSTALCFAVVCFAVIAVLFGFCFVSFFGFVLLLPLRLSRTQNPYESIRTVGSS